MIKFVRFVKHFTGAYRDIRKPPAIDNVYLRYPPENYNRATYTCDTHVPTELVLSRPLCVKGKNTKKLQMSVNNITAFTVKF